MRSAKSFDGGVNTGSNDIRVPLREMHAYDQQVFRGKVDAMEKQLREEIANYVSGSKKECDVKQIPGEIRIFVLLERIKKRGKGEGMGLLDNIALREVAERQVLRAEQQIEES